LFSFQRVTTTVLCRAESKTFHRSNHPMKNNIFRYLIIFFLASATMAGQASAQSNEKDREGQDHPLVSRYPGSVIHSYRQVAFDEYILILGKIVKKEAEKVDELEGKVTKIVYDVAEGRSTLEVFRNYEQALTGAGFTVLWQAKGKDEFGSWGDVRNFFGPMHLNDTNQRYLAAHLKRPEEGDVYVALYLNELKSTGSVRTQLHVVEVKPMEQGMIKVELSADQMLQDIERGGRVAIYGIHFDTGKDDAKAESKAAIDEIGKLLKESPQLKILVVGHTDSVGSYDYNLDLSMRRSLSVVNAVVKDHGIAPERLKAAGAGMMSPVATNRTDAGRAENRRVELVEIIDQ